VFENIQHSYPEKKETHLEFIRTRIRFIERATERNTNKSLHISTYKSKFDNF